MQLLEKNELCWCGSGKKYEDCHASFDEKLKALEEAGHIIPPREIIKTPEQIEKIKESCAINMAVLDYVAANIKAGMSTGDIDRMVYEETTKRGGVPAPLGYEGFPASVCTSINDEVCHGIPDDEVILEEGDIINVDVSTIYHGYYSDSSRMFLIGEVHEEMKKLVDVAKECVKKGLAAVKPWGFLGDVGQAVNDHAKAHGYTIVPDIGGHGVGLEFHEEPYVSYVTTAGTEMVLAPGMIFTIEPMVNMGDEEVFIDDENGWTVLTDDGYPSAQWEIMVLVTEEGHEVLCW